MATDEQVFEFGHDFRLDVRERRLLREGPTEGVPEVAGLDPGAVLDQPEEVGAGRGERAAYVVLAEPLELPDQRLAGALEVADEGVLGVSHRAGTS